MRRYQQWLATLVDNRKTGNSPGIWCATAALVILILILAGYVQPLAGWFQLRFWPALLCFVPSFVLGVSVGFLLKKEARISLRAYGALILIGCTLLQFFFAALIALSRPPGSFLLASLFVLTLAFHGYVNRATLKFPFMLACSAVAAVAALFLDGSRETLTVFAFVFPTGLLISLMSGQVGLREHYDRLERDKLKKAVHYKELNDRTEAHDKMSRRVLDLLSYNHDAGNTLSTVFLNAQLVEEQAARLSVAVPGIAELAKRISTLLEQLERLKALITRGHQLAEEMTSVAPASVLEIVDEVARDCRSLFPATSISIAKPEAPEAVVVCVHEGSAGLRRIVENILYNACEGNGRQVARRIEIRIAHERERVAIRCIDDGPGFNEQQLSSPPAPFQTSKPHGHGLGLFNVDHLLRASGGELSFQNAPDGGAIVEVYLARSETD